MSEDGRKLAELEARAAERRTQNIEGELAQREAEREQAAAAQGRRVAESLGATDVHGQAQRNAEDTVDALRRFRELHPESSRAQSLLMAEDADE